MEKHGKVEVIFFLVQGKTVAMVLLSWPFTIDPNAPFTFQALHFGRILTTTPFQWAFTSTIPPSLLLA